MAKRKKRVWNYSINPKSVKPKTIYYLSIDTTDENICLLFRDENQGFNKLNIPIKELILKKAIDTKKLTSLINKKINQWQK